MDAKMRISSQKRKSSLTSNYIRRGEPYIKFGDVIYIKEEESDIISRVLRDEKPNNDIVRFSGIKTCIRCDNESNEGFIIKGEDQSYPICSVCKITFYSSIEAISKCINKSFKYWSNPGFRIRENHEDETHFHDIIERRHIKSDRYIEIGIERKIHFKLENLTELSRELNNISSSDIIEYRNYEDTELCELCSNLKTSDRWIYFKDRGIPFCEECYNYLIDEIQHIKNTYSEYIISHKL
jgi:hypothetical protein